MCKFLAAAAFVAALAAPAVARAGDVAMRVQEIPLGARSLAAADPPMHFNMLAAHWLGPGTLMYRTHRLHGAWSSWQAADADVAPDGGTGRWHDGNLDWTGASDAIQFRARGSIRRVRAYELWSRVTTAPVRTLASAGEPPIVTRAGWGANEKIVRAKPLIAHTLRLAVVHHTAGTNTYTPAQAAAIVRGIEIYHVKGNGWNDIGYNFLVDRFGTVYEGRAGGMTRNVIGAHSQGFNSGTVGVALLGNFSQATPPKKQQDGLVALLAWRLDVAHIDPLSTVVYTSGGNLKFRAGKIVTLRAISGHRDTGPSECPGARAYALLPSIAKRVALTGLPKVYGPTVAGVLGGNVRFQARLSSALAWTVTVADALGNPVAHGHGTGSVVDWTWRSLVTTGVFTWTISTPGALAASGTIGTGRPVPPTLSLTGLAVTPGVVTPAPDGTGDTSTVSFVLSAAAHVTAQVIDATGAVVATPLEAEVPAGPTTFAWAASVLADGRYTLTVSAKPPSGTAVSASADVVVDRTLWGLAASPATFSPNGDGVDDSTALSFSLSQPVPVRIEIQQAGATVASLFSGPLAAGPHTLDWDGTNGSGGALPAGAYEAVVTITDALGDVSVAVPVTIE
jgi:flagellar hook assembly protein FlgD